MNRKQIAEHTLQLLEQGHYENASGQLVDLETLNRDCIAHTVCYNPDELTDILERVLAQSPAYDATEYEVVNETTLQGGHRLVTSGEFEKVGVLNFASAKNPGGGFLNGMQAQEESLARSSGLYPSLLEGQDYYDFHRQQKSSLYSDHMIYSPRCPVFRADDGKLLEAPYLVDFITSAAPNAGAIYQNERENIAHIPETLRRRSAKVLGLAAYHECDALVLGAWGCGVFKNNPQLVAKIFHEHLEGGFQGRFRKVLFSVLDNSAQRQTVEAFRGYFGE